MPEATTIEAPPLPDRERSQSISVLIVDDEPSMRLLLRTAMQRDGFQVTEASNGMECLEIFQQQRPDVVLMDAMMPQMDGFSCSVALQEMTSPNQTPILMITGLDDPQSVDRAFDAGAADYVTKPIHWALLRQRMRRLRDIIERQRAEQKIKESLKEKEALLKEIHHRVKNNLQIICSLLHLQSNSITDESSLALLKESQNRVRLMALIHEKLYQSVDVGKINLGDYIRDLCSHLLRSYEIVPDAVSLEVASDDIFLEIDTAVPCGLIVNELISNSLKYAFPNGEKGAIRIEAELADDTFCISYRDNGVGLPEGLEIHNVKTLGLQLITTLTEQLGGDLEIHSEGGTAFKLTNLLSS